MCYRCQKLVRQWHSHMNKYIVPFCMDHNSKAIDMNNWHSFSSVHIYIESIKSLKSCSTQRLRWLYSNQITICTIILCIQPSFVLSLPLTVFRAVLWASIEAGYLGRKHRGRSARRLIPINHALLTALFKK